MPEQNQQQMFSPANTEQGFTSQTATSIEQEKAAKKEQYAAEIRKWKHEYKKVKILFLDGLDGLQAVFFKEPNRLQLAAAEAMSIDAIGKVDLYKRGERLIADCYLGGDISIPGILSDTSTYMAVAQFVLYDLVEQKKTSWESC